MKCKICGSESGKYPLCRVCNIKKEQGLIIKCSLCGEWHYKSQACTIKSAHPENEYPYLYELKNTLISKSEQNFYSAILNAVPSGFMVFPQINLATFIERTDDSRFHNELFRNVDFLITDINYSPKIVVEINDMTHMTTERKERDEKVQKICEEAGIPILKLWTSYGINQEYIKNKISELLTNNSITRIHHFNNSFEQNLNKHKHQDDSFKNTYKNNNNRAKKKGCYIATCVYGSYDCPEVWTLRRYRDYYLSKKYYGKIFIKIYYLISPTLVKIFGNNYHFKLFFKNKLNKIVSGLQIKGFENTPYYD